MTTKSYSFIDENCELVLISVDYMPKVKISFNKRLKETKDLEDKIVSLNEIIDVKGDKAQGNQLTKLKVKDVTLVDIIPGEEWPWCSCVKKDNSRLILNLKLHNFEKL